MKTWQGEQWKIGGGAGWSWISYDPDLDLIYYGTANPSPWNPDQRPGDNKWSSHMFARRPETGEAIWAYQMNPHDVHDYDGVNENILLDLNIDGQPAQSSGPSRSERAHVYYGPRHGRDPVGRSFAFLNTTSRCDLKTGKLNVDPDQGDRV